MACTAPAWSRCAIADALALSVAVWMTPGVVLAQEPPGIGVRVDGCEGLSAEHLEERVVTELLLAPTTNIAVEVVCSDTEVIVRVSATERTDEHLERGVPRPTGDPDSAERALAIVIAQTLRPFLTMLEEMPAEPEPTAPVAPPPPPPPEPPPPEPPSIGTRLVLHVGADAHDVLAPFPTFRIGLTVAPTLTTWLRLLVGATFQVGQAPRAGDSVVQMDAYEGLVGLEAELVRTLPWVLTIDVALALGAVRMTGLNGAGRTGGESVGLAIDGTLGLSMWVLLPPVWLGARASIGGGTGLEALVAGETSVAYGRGIAGGQLLVGFEL